MLGSEHTVLRQMTPEQIAKLRSELDVVQTNAQVFGEMLIILQPGEEHPQDFEFLVVKSDETKCRGLKYINIFCFIGIAQNL